MTLQLPDGNVVPRRVDSDDGGDWLRRQLEEHRKAFESLQRNIDVISMQFPVQDHNLAFPAPTSSLPASAPHGQQVLYTPEAGVVWQLMFDETLHGSDGNGWVFLSGSPLYAEADDGATTSSEVPQVQSGGPSLTVPRDGIYQVVISGRLRPTQANTSAVMVPFNGSVQLNEPQATVYSGGAPNVGASVFVTKVVPLVEDSLSVRLYRSGGSGDVVSAFRRLIVTPRRLAS